MLAKIHSGAVYGLDAYPVEIEVDSADKGDPQAAEIRLTTIGL